MSTTKKMYGMLSGAVICGGGSAFSKWRKENMPEEQKTKIRPWRDPIQRFLADKKLLDFRNVTMPLEDEVNVGTWWVAVAVGHDCKCGCGCGIKLIPFGDSRGANDFSQVMFDEILKDYRVLKNLVEGDVDVTKHEDVERWLMGDVA